MSDLRKKFTDPTYRHSYADGFMCSYIGMQIRKLREQRGWTQEQLADLAGKRQSEVSRHEDASNESWTISSLRDYARAFDVALVVKFESFGERLKDIESFSVESLRVPSFAEDLFVRGDLRAVEAGVTPGSGGLVTNWVLQPLGATEAGSLKFGTQTLGSISELSTLKGVTHAETTSQVQPNTSLANAA